MPNRSGLAQLYLVQLLHTEVASRLLISSTACNNNGGCVETKAQHQKKATETAMFQVREPCGIDVSDSFADPLEDSIPQEAQMTGNSMSTKRTVASADIEKAD